MRISLSCLVFLMLLVVLAEPQTSYAQGGGGESTKPPSKKASPPKRGSKSKLAPDRQPAPPAPTRAPIYGEVTVKTGLAGCSVLLDGQTRGTTNQDGFLRLSSLSPGQHIIIVRKEGFHEDQRPVELFAGRHEVIEIKLNKKLTTAEMLVQAEADYNNASYDRAIENSRKVLTAQPDNPRANLLLGQSYYLTGNAESVSYLVKAIAQGETVVIPIKHHHREGITGLDDNLCSGQLTFRKGAFEFKSKDMSGHDFSVPFSKIYAVKNEVHKAGRVHTKVGIQKGNKEDKKDYNFHVAAAEVVRQGARSLARCSSPNCQPMVEALYQFLQQLKQ
jgi:hypothetical protein